MSKKKTMGKPKDAVWLHVRKYFLVVIGLQDIIRLYPLNQISQGEINNVQPHDQIKSTTLSDLSRIRDKQQHKITARDCFVDITQSPTLFGETSCTSFSERTGSLPQTNLQKQKAYHEYSFAKKYIQLPKLELNTTLTTMSDLASARESLKF